MQNSPLPMVLNYLYKEGKQGQVFVGVGLKSGEKLKRGRGTNKTPVVGVVSRDNKRVSAKVLHKLSFADLKKVAKDNIDLENAVLMTDDFTGYIPFKNLVKHETINHSQGEYVKNDKNKKHKTHTNTIEGYWSLVKRTINIVF